MWARIDDDGFGSRVRGRAGIDIASAGLIGMIAGIVIFSIYSLLAEHSPAILLFDVAVLLIPGAVLWLRLISPQDAEPLVRFVRRVLEKNSTVRSVEVAPSHFDRTPVQAATLKGDRRELPAPSEYDVAQAILAMQPDSFLIIDFGSNRFMQSALQYDRFILEKCEGSDHELYRAKGDFECTEVIAVMTDYLRGSRPSEQIVWEKVPG